MNVFLGVSRNLLLRRLKPGDTSYWCVYLRPVKAQPGDLILLYVPFAASQKLHGIGQIYKVISQAQSGIEADCNSRGMLTVETELIVNLENRITMKDLKKDSILSQWGAVGRNMQGVTFTTNQAVWDALRALIILKNADINTELLPSKTREHS